VQRNRSNSPEDIAVDVLVTAGQLTRLAGVISDDDLPRAIVRALAVLEEHGSLRVSQFAEIDRCSQPAATALIRRLVADGYATRSKDPDDSRAVVVELTRAGRARLDESRRAIASALVDQLPGFDTERLLALKADLNELFGAMRTSASRQHPTPR